MSLNPNRIITKVEFGTSSLKERISAINNLCINGYHPYILIAPIIITENFENDYTELIKYMKKNLIEEAQHNIIFELIFMTYSYIHRKINEDAFPKAINLYSKDLMSSKGIGKYHYKNDIKKSKGEFLLNLLKQNFPDCSIKYIV